MKKDERLISFGEFRADFVTVYSRLIEEELQNVEELYIQMVNYILGTDLTTIEEAKELYRKYAHAETMYNYYYINRDMIRRQQLKYARSKRGIEVRKKYEEANKDKLVSYKKEYYLKNKEYIINQHKEYRKKNRNKINEYMKNYQRKRRKEKRERGE